MASHERVHARWFNSPWVVAIIAGSFAIIASTVTSCYSASATRDVLEVQLQAEDRKTDAEARGAARVLLSEFLSASNEMKDMAMGRVFEDFGPEYEIAITPSQLTLIASRVRPEEWNKIDLALGQVAGLGRYMRDRADPANPARPLGGVLTKHAVGLIAADMAYVGEGMAALMRLAGLSAIGVPSIDPEGVWERIQDALELGQPRSG